MVFPKPAKTLGLSQNRGSRSSDDAFTLHAIAGGTRMHPTIKLRKYLTDVNQKNAYNGSGQVSFLIWPGNEEA